MKDILGNQRIEKRVKSHYAAKSRYYKKTSVIKSAFAFFKSHGIHMAISAVLLGFVLFVIFLPKPYKADRVKTAITEQNDIIASVAEENADKLAGGELNGDMANVSGNADGGAGLLDVERVKDFEYTVLPGETLSEIAYVFGIEQKLLISYNTIRKPDSIRAGQKIVIPSQDNLQNFEELIKLASLRAEEAKKEKEPQPNLSHLSKLPKNVAINVVKQNDGTAITAHFSVVTEIDDGQISYVWDLGNGRKAFRKETAWTYTAPGTYPVKLTVSDRYGVQAQSNVVFIDVPHTDVFKSMNREFTTLSGVGSYLAIPGEITRVNVHGAESDVFPFEKVEKNEHTTIYKAQSPGYFDVLISDGVNESQLYLFVSPLESVHSDRKDLNWYRTQFNTGTPSNCGPAVVSMGIGWAMGQYVPVSKIREQIGWKGNGSTSFEELLSMLQKNSIQAQYRQTRSPQDIFDIIDKDNIAIILYNSGSVSWTKGSPSQNYFGRYYNDSVGHYIIIKGYTQDKNYFIVYDPIPSDWGSNSLRYGDGVSMIGRNRYYPVREVFGSLRRYDVIEINR